MIGKAQIQSKISDTTKNGSYFWRNAWNYEYNNYVWVYTFVSNFYLIPPENPIIKQKISLTNISLYDMHKR